MKAIGLANNEDSYETKLRGFHVGFNQTGIGSFRPALGPVRRMEHPPANAGNGSTTGEPQNAPRADAPLKVMEDEAIVKRTPEDDPPCDNPRLKVAIGTDEHTRILVVDDEPGIRMLSARALVRSGYYVEVAEDGATGWQTLCASAFDLLITDHHMPHLTGLGLVKKARLAGMTVPVILTTAVPPEEELRRNPWFGIDAVLLKPFGFGELLAKVRTVLHGPPRTNPPRHSPALFSL